MEITKEIIQEWKDLYKKVFMVTLNNTRYYYKTLTREDYNNILQDQLTNPEFNYEYQVIKTCVLSPTIEETFKETLALKSGIGVPLLEQIMLNSGWETVESVEL